MTKTKNRTRKGGRSRQKGGFWPFGSKSKSYQELPNSGSPANTGPKPNPQRDLAFREVWAAYRNFYNKRRRFTKRWGGLEESELAELNDDNLAAQANSDGLVAENVRAYRVGAKALQGVKNVTEKAGKATAQGARALGTGVATGARALGTGVATGARALGTGVATGARALGTGAATGARAIGTAASKTGSWFSRKATNAGTAFSRGATALSQSASKAVESPATTARRLLDEVEQNPSLNSGKKNEILSKVRSLMNRGSMRATEKLNIGRRLAAARTAKPVAPVVSGYNGAEGAVPNAASNASSVSIQENRNSNNPFNQSAPSAPAPSGSSNPFNQF